MILVRLARSLYKQGFKNTGVLGYCFTNQKLILVSNLQNDLTESRKCIAQVLGYRAGLRVMQFTFCKSDNSVIFYMRIFLESFSDLCLELCQQRRGDGRVGLGGATLVEEARCYRAAVRLPDGS